MTRTALAALLCLLPSGCGGETTAGATNERPAKSAPTLEYADLARIDAVLAQHRGRGVLLNFWAIWCAPCVEELPELLEVAHEFREQGGDVVLVSYDAMIPNQGRDAVLKEVKQFASRRKLDLPIYVLDAPDEDAINARFDLPGGIPVTLAFDREGKLVDRVDEQAGKARFVEMMRKALAK